MVVEELFYKENFMSLRNWFSAVVVAFMVALSCVASPSLAGEQAADFTLRDINNKEVSLSDFKGKVILLSFWATWCAPCKVEMKHLNVMYEEHKDDGFVVLSVSSDDARTTSQVKPYIKRKRYNFPVVLDKKSTVTLSYNPMKTLPYGVLIGRDFSVVKHYSGYSPGDETVVETDIEAQLKIK